MSAGAAIATPALPEPVALVVVVLLFAFRILDGVAIVTLFPGAVTANPFGVTAVPFVRP